MEVSGSLAKLLASVRSALRSHRTRKRAHVRGLQYVRARAWMDAGFPEEAVRVYKNSDAMDTSLADVIELQGSALSQAGLKALGEERLEMATRLRLQGGAKTTRDATQYYIRARYLARSGFEEQAQKLFQEAEALDPTFADAVEAQGELLDLMGEGVMAAEKYRTARRSRAAMRTGLPDRHFVHRQRGRFVAEIIAYDAVLRSLKKNALPYIARGNAYLATGRPAEALADYERALRLKPNAREIAVLKGEALFMLGRYADALSALDWALETRPDDGEALNCRAIVLIALGRLKEANGDWRRQLQLMPDGHAGARACVALRMADYAAALPQLELALAREPGDPYWQLYRLTAQRRLGIAAEVSGPTPAGCWPAPLLALHSGRMTEDQVLERVDSADQLAEALFQIGIVNFDRERSVSERYWRRVAKQSSPYLVEFAAAHNELSRAESATGP